MKMRQVVGGITACACLCVCSCVFVCVFVVSVFVRVRYLDVRAFFFLSI